MNVKNHEKKLEHFLDIARAILAGEKIGRKTYLEITATPDEDALLLCPGADMLREAAFGRSVHLCSILNGKSGHCSEDCAFCAQSVHCNAAIDEYPLMPAENLAMHGKELEDTPVNRYSVVTSGRGLSKREIETVAEGLSMLDKSRVGACASLGILDRDSLITLRNAGVQRYHHNLETAESYFPKICTTHTYKDRVETILAAKEAGMSICAGGIVGLGETLDQILELAVALKELEVDAVPLNFFVPIKGTTGNRLHSLTPLKCLKIIALFRYVLPSTEIIICGGREYNLKELHPLVFYAGASGIMTGNYLTTSGRSLWDDLELLSRIGLETRTDLFCQS